MLLTSGNLRTFSGFWYDGIFYCQQNSLFRQVCLFFSRYCHFFARWGFFFTTYFDPAPVLYSELSTLDWSFSLSYYHTFTSPLPRQPPHAPAKTALPTLPKQPLPPPPRLATSLPPRLQCPPLAETSPAKQEEARN